MYEKKNIFFVFTSWSFSSLIARASNLAGVSNVVNENLVDSSSTVVVSVVGISEPDVVDVENVISFTSRGTCSCEFEVVDSWCLWISGTLAVSESGTNYKKNQTNFSKTKYEI